ncbi:hypothetical protein M422DRAFT_246423 [Sphaerobolus stellatus SS14]|nr:hypothetical protein M422DRAFT_246423 [Sphaerobolus stellatus SS14]
MRWDGADVRVKYSRSVELGDIVKIIGKANTAADNFALQQFTSAMTYKPLTAINMGQAGQMSRILNTILTPVTHPSLPTKAAPGQLSFYLFGSPISQSMSPTIHNTGFETLGLPHHCGLYETEVIDEKIKAILKSPDFGGALPSASSSSGRDMKVSRNCSSAGAGALISGHRVIVSGALGAKTLKYAIDSHRRQYFEDEETTLRFLTHEWIL